MYASDRNGASTYVSMDVCQREPVQSAVKTELTQISRLKTHPMFVFGTATDLVG